MFTTSLTFYYHGLIRLSGNRHEGNVYRKRHIAPVMGLYHLLAGLILGGGSSQGDDTHSGERKSEGTTEAFLAPIAFNHHLGKANLLTGLRVNHLANKYDNIARWLSGFERCFDKSCSCCCFLQLRDSPRWAKHFTDLCFHLDR
jgi:hypothetical protein